MADKAPKNTELNDEGDVVVDDEKVAKSLESKSDAEERGTSGPVPAELRARGGATSPTRNGLMDNMSRRSSHDALEGHYVTIDLNDAGAKKGYKEAGLEGHEGNFGIYVQPGDVEPKTGIPKTAHVRLRDETNGRVTVPYDALSPSEARGR